LLTGGMTSEAVVAFVGPMVGLFDGSAVFFVGASVPAGSVTGSDDGLGVGSLVGLNVGQAPVRQIFAWLANAWHSEVYEIPSHPHTDTASSELGQSCSSGVGVHSPTQRERFAIERFAISLGW